MPKSFHKKIKWDDDENKWMIGWIPITSSKPHYILFPYGSFPFFEDTNNLDPDKRFFQQSKIWERIENENYLHRNK